jgi:hypothetical protein
MDKLLFYTLNNRGLPQGPNYERTSMLGKLAMFNNGGPIKDKKYERLLQKRKRSGWDSLTKKEKDYYGEAWQKRNPINYKTYQNYAKKLDDNTYESMYSLPVAEVYGDPINTGRQLGKDIAGGAGYIAENTLQAMAVPEAAAAYLIDKTRGKDTEFMDVLPKVVSDVVGRKHKGQPDVITSATSGDFVRNNPGIALGLSMFLPGPGGKASKIKKMANPLPAVGGSLTNQMSVVKKNILPGLKNRGKQYDQRYTDLDIANVFNNPSKVEYIGTKSGRPLVRVEMPDGFSEYFYKSSGWAGKKGDGVGGTTQGLWQPFGGHTESMGTSDWFIKDSGYKDYYGSNTYETIAKNLDNVLVKNTGVKDADALNKAINFRNVSGNVDTYKPDYRNSIFSKGDINEFWHGGTHIDPPRIKQVEASTTRVEKRPEPIMPNVNVTNKQFADKAMQFYKEGKVIDREPINPIRDLLPYPCYDYTCMEFVKDVDKASGRHSIPDRIGTNVEFFKEADRLGYQRVHPDSTVLPGDIISFYDPKKTAKEFPKGKPYHAGIIVSDSTYTDTGGGEKYLPIGYPVRQTPFRGKNPYYAYRWKNEKGGSFPVVIKDKFKYLDGGDIVEPGDGWQYLKKDGNYLTRKKGNTDWITAKGLSKESIQSKIYNEAITNNQEQPQVNYAEQVFDVSDTKDSVINDTTGNNVIDSSYTQPTVSEKNIKNKEPFNRETIRTQQMLVDAGYDIGKTGPTQNGIDGIMGDKTKAALAAYNKGISNSDLQKQDLAMQNEILSKEYESKPQTANYVNNLQSYLIDKGYDIPNSGVMDTKTKQALKDYETSGKFATLPVFPSNPERREEVCKNKGDGYGCSKQTSLKLGNLFGNTDMDKKALWAQDAWFNRDAVIKNGGTLLYETEARGRDIPNLPKEMYGILQVGDYVHLDRRDTKSSKDYGSRKSKLGFDNEKIEHMGIIIGKDPDGTPLVWHASETGKAYVKRVDEPITLDDHKGLGAYKIASIARAPGTKDEYQNEIAQNPYFSKDWESPYEKSQEVVKDVVKPFDPDNMLVPLEGSNEFERERINEMNNNVQTFMDAGFPQDDVNKVAQIVIGGLLDREAKRGDSYIPGRSEGIPIPRTNIRIPLTKGTNPVRAGSPEFGTYGKDQSALEYKENLATVAKAVGLKRDEVSKGIYQMKENMNFADKQRLLEKIGLPKEKIFDNLENQTKGATLLLLTHYRKLKEDPNYDRETDQVKIKAEDGTVWSYPASYILAGGWSRGPSWYKTKAGKKELTSREGREYSNKAIENMGNVVETQKGDNYGKRAAKEIYDNKQLMYGKINKANTIKRMVAEGYDEKKIDNLAIEDYKQKEYNKFIEEQDKAIKNINLANVQPESTDTNIFMDPNIIIPSNLYSDFTYGAYDLPEVTVTAKRKRK